MNFKKLAFIPLILALAALVVFPAAAQSGSVEATLIVPPGEYTVGDPVLLTLAVTHPAGYQVIFPEMPVEWGDFIVHSQSPLTTVENPDGTETTTQLIDARLFSPGAFETPPLDVTIADEAGSVAQVTAPPAAVTVASVLIEGDTQLRDIKPQASIPYLNLVPWLIGVLLLGLIAAGFLLWNRRRQRLAAEAAIDRRLPNEVALDELARIFNLGLPEQDLYKEYYTLLSDCIRSFMEAVYHIPALERTTGEILISLRGKSADPQVSRQLIAFLSACDLVKFSKFKPELNEAHQALSDARGLVESTWTAVAAAATPPDSEAGPSTPGTVAGPGETAPKMELTA